MDLDVPISLKHNSPLPILLLWSKGLDVTLSALPAPQKVYVGSNLTSAPSSVDTAFLPFLGCQLDSQNSNSRIQTGQIIWKHLVAN